MMFLQMWNVTERQPEDYGKYAVPKDYEHPQSTDHSGFVLPYGDSPMDREQVGERVYLDILNQARSYVHIMTPYLILDDEMVNALSYAAKRGIEDVYKRQERGSALQRFPDTAFLQSGLK